MAEFPQRYNNLIQNYKFLPAYRILPDDVFLSLSEEARNLYAVVWNRMSVREAIEVSISDMEATQRSRFGPEQLQAAQSELVRASVLHIEKPSRSVGDARSTYIFVEQDDEAAA